MKVIRKMYSLAGLEAGMGDKLPISFVLSAEKKDLHLTACGLVAIQTGRNDLGIVKHQNVRRIQQAGQFEETVMRQRTGTAVYSH